MFLWPKAITNFQATFKAPAAKAIEAPRTKSGLCMARPMEMMARQKSTTGTASSSASVTVKPSGTSASDNTLPCFCSITLPPS